MEDGFRVHRVGVPRQRLLETTLYSMKALLQVRRLKPDLVHSQSVRMGVPAYVARKLWRTPYLVWGRGTDVYLPWLFKRPISRLILRNANAVIALTRDMKQEMQKIYSREVEVIPNGIELQDYRDLGAKAEIRRSLGLGGDERLVLFVGTLRPVKGLPFLIEAMSIMRQHNPVARLMLVGDGQERRGLQGLVEESDMEDAVTFVGEVPNEKVPEYMAAADVLVLPSLSEGFPVTILEAMAAGLPVVATRVGGLTEIVEDGENGFLVEPRSPQETADRLCLLLADDSLRERISRNNREKAKAYSWDRVADRLEALYQEIIQVGRA